MLGTDAPRVRAGATGTRSLGRLDWSTWPKYEAAAAGFRDYWYPVTWSRKVGRKPIQVMAIGETIMLIREAGVVRALHDRCPHRGVPLSHQLATQEFPGTWTCCYHGWTFDLESGTLVAAITDGPDSPICGKVAVRTYPVAERFGIVWVYVGDGDPPPVESDIPSELLAPDAVVCGRITRRPGDWRFGAENGFDEGHAKFLHRKSLWAWRTELPVWIQIHMEQRDGWLTRVSDKVHWTQEYPGLGTWPPYKAPWRRRGKRGPTVGIRLPGILRVAYRGWDHYEWWVPQGAGDHHYIQLAGTRARGLRALWFRLYYWTIVRWIFHGQFNDQDALMVDVMDAPPERLYRPDKAIIAWRELCETDAREPATRSASTEGPDRPTAAQGAA
jgi:nitrite reductase/ring-hydroxylating ferredoxin subunit